MPMFLPEQCGKKQSQSSYSDANELIRDWGGDEQAVQHAVW